MLEKTRSRGFWPPKPFKGGKKGRSKGFKGKSKGLAHRIANSTCRLRGQPGHWKAECPSKKTSSGSEANQVPTSFVIDIHSCLQDIPEVDHDPQSHFTSECFAVFEDTLSHLRARLKVKLSSIPALKNMSRAPAPESLPKSRLTSKEPLAEWSAQDEASLCFSW